MADRGIDDMRSDALAVTKALAAPFEAGEVKFKPQVVKGNRALAAPYLDARAIQDRLDDVLGVDGWQDEYTPLPDGSVVCRLQLRIAGAWISKMDVGSPSEQKDSGDRLKAAFSDALKRASVKFGIGRYLYRVLPVWAEYDPAKKQFPHPPQLSGAGSPPAVQEKKAAATSGKKGGNVLPANGAELLSRLRDYDSKLGGEGLCGKGALLDHIIQSGVKAGFGPDLTKWSSRAIAYAVEQTKAFEAGLRKPRESRKAVA